MYLTHTHKPSAISETSANLRVWLFINKLSGFANYMSLPKEQVNMYELLSSIKVMKTVETHFSLSTQPTFFLHKSHTPTQPVTQELSHFSYLTHLLHILLFHLTIPKAEQQRRWGNFETSGYFQNFFSGRLPPLALCCPRTGSISPASKASKLWGVFQADSA